MEILRSRCNDQLRPFAPGSGEHCAQANDCRASTPDKPLATRLVTLATVISARIMVGRPSSAFEPTDACARRGRRAPHPGTGVLPGLPFVARVSEMISERCSRTRRLQALARSGINAASEVLRNLVEIFFATYEAATSDEQAALRFGSGASFCQALSAAPPSRGAFSRNRLTRRSVW